MNDMMASEEYRQHRVNIKVRMGDDLRDRLVGNETNSHKAIFTGSAFSGVWDVNLWEPLLEIDDGMLDESRAFADVVTSVNGLGNDHMLSVLGKGNRKWLKELMLNRIRYIGHSSQKFDSRRAKYITFGAQEMGIRPFFGWQISPLHSLLTLDLIHHDEAGAFRANAPRGTGQGKITAVLVPYNFKNLSEIFKAENKQFLENRQEFEEHTNTRHEKTSRIIDMLTRVHNFALLSGLTMMHVFVRENLCNITVPVAPSIQPTNVAANTRLNFAQSNSWLLGLASKYGLLPHEQYADILGDNKSPEAKRYFMDQRTRLLQNIFPQNRAEHYFGFNPADGSVVGFNLLNRNINKGTAHGDMIEAVNKASDYMWIAMEDYVYHATRNIVGRVVFPCKQYGFGAFL